MITECLITAFEPFGGETTNASLEVIEALQAAETLAPFVEFKVLPVSFDDASVAVVDSVNSLNPQSLILLGEAKGRSDILIEKVAANYVDAKIPDNSGVQPRQERVDAGGPDTYLSTLPVDRIVASLRQENLPVTVSLCSGTFVCNSTFYRAMHFLATKGLRVPAGFVHLPALPQQAKGGRIPSLSLVTMCQAVSSVAKTTISSVKVSCQPDRWSHVNFRQLK